MADNPCAHDLSRYGISIWKSVNKVSPTSLLEIKRHLCWFPCRLFLRSISFTYLWYNNNPHFLQMSLKVNNLWLKRWIGHMKPRIKLFFHFCKPQMSRYNLHIVSLGGIICKNKLPPFCMPVSASTATTFSDPTDHSASPLKNHETSTWIRGSKDQIIRRWLVKWCH